MFSTILAGRCKKTVQRNRIRESQATRKCCSLSRPASFENFPQESPQTPAVKTFFPAYIDQFVDFNNPSCLSDLGKLHFNHFNKFVDCSINPQQNIVLLKCELCMNSSRPSTQNFDCPELKVSGRGYQMDMTPRSNDSCTLFDPNCYGTKDGLDKLLKMEDTPEFPLRGIDFSTLLQPVPATAQCSQVKGRVFVTVGSNPEARFDGLIQEVTSPNCLQVLKKRGYTSLVIQHGNCRFKPIKESNWFKTEHFGSRPNLKELINDHIYAASLVISHAGAESIFQTLRAQRPLVVVLNSQFLGKYELELAKQLSKFMYCCSPETLVETLSIMNLECLLPYPPHPSPFNIIANHVNSLTQFLLEDEALAPFQETVSSTVSGPESQYAVPKPPYLEPTSSASNKLPTKLKSQEVEGKN